MNKKALKKFQSLYKKNFGRELSDKEASEKIEKLLAIYAVVYDISVWSDRSKLLTK